MADAAQDFIAAVQTEFRVLQASSLELVGPARGWPAVRVYPAILWRYGPILHSPPEKVGGGDAPILTEQQAFVFRIWFADDEKCRAAKNDLIRAARKAAKGTANLTVGAFDWLTENAPGWTNNGSGLEGTISVRLQVHEKPIATLRVTIKSQQHTETIDT